MKLRWKIVIGVFSLIVLGAIIGSRSPQSNSQPYYVLCNGAWQNANQGPCIPSESITSSSPPAIVSATPRLARQQASGELCHGARYTSCPPGEKFYCDSTGGECVSVDDVFCNGAWYSPCGSGSQFSCPANGPAQCTALNATTSTVPQARTIVAKANVGLLCHYKITDSLLKADYSSDEDSNGELLEKASGAIVNPQGYILTAKHLVDPQWTNWAYASTTSADEQQLNNSLQFDYCDVGVPQTGDYLPTPEEIKTSNPSLELSNPFPYIATLYFEPSRGGMSGLEYEETDFAVLKITAPLHSCQTFNLCQLPSSFPYNPVLYDAVPGQPNMPNLLIDFGYPAEAINDYGGAFTEFYLKGAVGRLTDYYGGDQYFKNEYLMFQWTADDVRPGRSGSPIYWQGYVAGLSYAVDLTNNTIDYAIGMPAIYQILKDNNLEEVLATH